MCALHATFRARTCTTITTGCAAADLASDASTFLADFVADFDNLLTSIDAAELSTKERTASSPLPPHPLARCITLTLILPSSHFSLRAQAVPAKIALRDPRTWWRDPRDLGRLGSTMAARSRVFCIV